VAGKTGRPVAAFRSAQPQPSVRWNPEHHFGGMVFDLPWARRGLDPTAFEFARQNRGLGVVAQLLGLLEHLEIRGPVIGTSHGLVETTAGKTVYVAVEYLIRPADRDTGAALWTTLGAALEIAPPQHFQACTAPSVQFDALATEMRPHLEGRKLKTIQAYQLAGAPIHSSLSERSVLRREADGVDSAVRRLDAQSTAALTYFGVFPELLIEAAAPGGMVKEALKI
jgi:hypothetical protein